MSNRKLYQAPEFVTVKEMAALLGKRESTVQRYAEEQGWKEAVSPEMRRCFATSALPAAMQKKVFRSLILADNKTHPVAALVYEGFRDFFDNMNFFYCESVPVRFKFLRMAAMLCKELEIIQDAVESLPGVSVEYACKVMGEVSHHNGDFFSAIYNGEFMYIALRDIGRRYWLFTLFEMLLDFEDKYAKSSIDRMGAETFCTAQSGDPNLPFMRFPDQMNVPASFDKMLHMPTPASFKAAAANLQ